MHCIEAFGGMEPLAACADPHSVADAVERYTAGKVSLGIDYGAAASDDHIIVTRDAVTKPEVARAA